MNDAVTVKKWLFVTLMSLFLMGGALMAQTVATPTLSQSSCSMMSQFVVSVSDATSGATIYYTLDGSTPTTSSPSIASGNTVLISKTATLKAYAVKSGMTDSSIASAAYNITGGIATGIWHTVILKSDGTVWTWGDNSGGELGDGTTTSRWLPAQISSLSGIIAISAGGIDTAALKSDGTVWMCGANNAGQLGDGTTTTRTSPVQVSSLTDVVAVSTSGAHTIAVKSNGTVWAWGNNSSGKLGDGTTTNRTTPVQVSSLTNVVAVSAATNYTVALKSDGTVWAWGANTEGELGDGTTSERHTPVQVSGLTNVISIAAGGNHNTLAVKDDGTVWAWGANDSGELGDGTTTECDTPEQVTSLSDVVMVTTVTEGSLALKSDGTVWGWGLNGQGRIGSGKTDDYETSPVQVSGLSGALAISGNGPHGVAAVNDGSVWCWGQNTEGELGDGISSYWITSPLQVSGLTNIIALSAGGSPHAFALAADGTVWGWGSNSYGQLGDGTTIQENSPEQNPYLSNITAISAGSFHSLALQNDGTVWAWGNNAFGQLGDGTTDLQVAPEQVSALSNITAVNAGWDYSLALQSNGAVWAWGDNTYHQLGDGTTTPESSPEQVFSNAIAIVGAGYTTLALKNDGTVWQWGNTISSPTQVSGLTGIVAISSSMSHSLALKSDGTLWVWGSNSYGNFGNGNTTWSSTPVQSTSWSDFIDAIAGLDYTMAIRSDGSLWSWGNNGNGQLGDGTTTNRTSPVQVTDLPGVVAISTGGARFLNYTVSLALKPDGTVASWGDYTLGQTGLGYYRDSPSAVPVLGVNLLSGTPTISITSPSTPATGILGQPVSLQVSTSDTTGTVTQVDYYNERIKIGTATSSPFSLSWNPGTWGNFHITAVATDSNGSTSLRSGITTIAFPADVDGDGLPDTWEMTYFGHTGVDPNGDPDGDGYTNLQEYQHGSDPTNYYSQPSGSGYQTIVPAIAVVSGDSQTGSPSVYLNAPLIVEVTDSSTATPLPNAPVAFAVSSGGGSIMNPATGSGTSLNLTTDSSGLAQVQYQPATSNTTSTITATTSGHTVTFTATTSPGDGTFDAPTNLNVTLSADKTFTLTWVNHATTATSIIIEQSTDQGATWSTIATLTDPTAASYTVSGLTPETGYMFGVSAHK